MRFFVTEQELQAERDLAVTRAHLAAWKEGRNIGLDAGAEMLDMMHTSFAVADTAGSRCLRRHFDLFAERCASASKSLRRLKTPP